VSDLRIGGPNLPIGYLLFVGGLCAAVVTTQDPGPEEVRAVIRATAFTSAVAFLSAFCASALHRLRPSAVTRWLMANRRYLGLSLAASHWWHLLAIIALVRLYSDGSAPIAPVVKIFGSAGFVFLGLMAATSNDAAQRALGRGWGVLHTVGVYVLWLDFIFTYSGTATVAPFHALMTLVFAAAFVLRMLAWSARRAAVTRA
jgi:DMSO/TMAO reductase YedYZ heme-binding membrane subunit